MNSEDGIQKILKAAHFAAQKHTHQRRKGVTAEPYINHLIEVAQLVASAITPPETAVVIAALLHDSIEDVGVTKEEIVATFGHTVAELVVEMTDDKTKPKSERKRLQVVDAPFKSAGAGLIKLADKISNLRTIRVSPPPDWSSERKREYVTWSSNVVEGLKSPNAILRAEFDEARLQLLQTLD